LAVLAGCLLVLVGGLYDDYRPATRGLRHQIGRLRRGEVTPGIVKAGIIVLASALVAWMLDLSGLRLALAIPVLAGCANLWNLLDVAPGRALKWFLPAGAALWAVLGGSSLWGLMAGVVVTAVPLLALDLLELGMLGDAGANVLGFLVGAGCVVVLPTPWLAAVLAGILVLHLLAETVTLSRLIDATPPLRWFDRLGRRTASSSAR
jgi:UDP-N-acetylmuramyl pentapeptide phosphotransferase/UDP-N-acetylglucosamine-1-phosphate transferase